MPWKISRPSPRPSQNATNSQDWPQPVAPSARLAGAKKFNGRNLTMSCFINPVEEDQCVFLTYEGEMPPIEVMAARYEATGLLATKHWNRIVVNITKLRSFTELELFVFAKGLSSDVPQSARVAFVIRPEQVRQAKFIEKVAQNDGAFLTLFCDVEEAATWVKEMKPHKRTQRRPADNHL